MKRVIQLLGVAMFAACGDLPNSSSDASLDSNVDPSTDGSFASDGSLASDASTSESDASLGSSADGGAPRDTDASTPPPGPAVSGGFCDPQARWCWERGLPLSGVRGETPDQIVAFGASGVVLHWMNGAWSPLGVPTDQWIVSAWMKAPSDTWASDASGALWHYDGVEWRVVVLDGSPSLGELTGGSDGSLWAEGSQAGAHGASVANGLWRREGRQWTRMASAPVYCLGGDYLPLAGNDIWSAGLICDGSQQVVGGRVDHFDGSTWSQVGTTIDDLNWYPTISRVGTVIRVNNFEWNGSTWRATELEPDPFQMSQSPSGCTAAFELGDDQIWCTGRGGIDLRAGGRWIATLDDSYSATSAWSRLGTMPTEIWAGGGALRAWATSEVAYRIITSELQVRTSQSDWSPRPGAQPIDVSGSASDDVWIARSTGLTHYDGRTYNAIEIPGALGANRAAQVVSLQRGSVLVSAGIDDSITEFHANELLHYDGQWSVLLELGTSDVNPWEIIDVAAARDDDIWVVRHTRIQRLANYVLMHFDGTRWSEVASWMTEAALPSLAVSPSGATWLFNGETVRDLTSSGAEIEVDVRMEDFRRSLWIDATSIWLSTSKQAIRHSLPR